MRGLFAAALGGGFRAAAPPSTPWAPDDDRWYGQFPGYMSNAGRRVTPDTAMSLSAVYACVNLLSKTVASLPLRMYRRDIQGQSFEAPEHPLNDVLEHQPNSWQTAWDFRAMLMMHLLLRGNAYAEIRPGSRGFADHLEPIHPDRVKVERLEDNSIRYTVTQPKGPDRVLIQDEMFHIRTNVSLDGLKGVSPVGCQFARETVGLSLAAEEHGARMFSNGARPSGVLEIPKTLSDPAFERLKG
jgi:HK97 family phage portal protein